ASFLLAHQTPAAALAGLIIVVVGSTSTLAWLGRAGRVGEAVALGLVAASTAVLTAGYVAWMARADDAWIAVGAAATAAVIALGASFIVANSGPPAWAAGRWKRAALGLSPAWFGEVAAPVIGLVLAMQGAATVWAVGGAIETDVAAPGAVALTVGAASWFAVAAIANQRWAAAVGAVHAQCTSWLLLATAGVRILEAYTLPGAFVLLVIGAWWLTDSPSTSSWSALGPALGLGLGPSTLAALADQGPRALWVIGSAALVVAVGALTRLAAPVVFGAVCLGTLAIIELAPLVGGLPRYLTFGVAGALLLLLGATFEQRRADLAALNRQLRSLR
ncbi:MAG: hypothetical protein KDB24_06575, partial [Microthrixaceae bacterium]|nr:hypothetical protein [Microthrixaceae bacterium]